MYNQYRYECTNCGDAYIFNNNAVNPTTWKCKKCRKLEEEEQGDMSNFDGNVIDSQDMKGQLE